MVSVLVSARDILGGRERAGAISVQGQILDEGTGQRIKSGSVSRSTIVLASSRGILLAFGVVSNYLAARILGPAGRGELAAVLQAGYLVGFFVLFGLDRALAVVAPGAASEVTLSTGRFLMRKRSMTVLAIGVVGTGAAIFGLLPDFFVHSFSVAMIAVFNSGIRLFEASVINDDRPQRMGMMQAWSGSSTRRWRWTT